MKSLKDYLIKESEGIHFSNEIINALNNEDATELISLLEQDGYKEDYPGAWKKRKQVSGEYYDYVMILPVNKDFIENLDVIIETGKYWMLVDYSWYDESSVWNYVNNAFNEIGCLPTKECPNYEECRQKWLSCTRKERQRNIDSLNNHI